MGKIISVHSFRGGTGKSNLTANLAVAVARAGYRVGVIDADIQSPGIYVIFRLKEDEAEFYLNDFLWGNCSIRQATCDVAPRVREEAGGQREISALYLIPSSPKQKDGISQVRSRIWKGHLGMLGGRARGPAPTWQTGM